MIAVLRYAKTAASRNKQAALSVVKKTAGTTNVAPRSLVPAMNIPVESNQDWRRAGRPRGWGRGRSTRTARASPSATPWWPDATRPTPKGRSISRCRAANWGFLRAAFTRAARFSGARPEDPARLAPSRPSAAEPGLDRLVRVRPEGTRRQGAAIGWRLRFRAAVAKDALSAVNAAEAANLKPVAAGPQILYAGLRHSP